MGILSLPPHPLLFELQYEPGMRQDLQTVLPYLLRIDAAHILMLSGQGLLAPTAAAGLLDVHGELESRTLRGEIPFETAGPHRGLFWLYEQHYIHRLGREVGGAVHVARSRNDINATVARLRARDELIRLLDRLGDLLDALMARAAENTETVMSCFTHYQPAQPSTLGHYLAGIGAELGRTGEWLAAAFDAVDRSPMGAAAGAGTSFPVDRELVARYLGFSRVIENAADAVASRDYLIQMLSAAAAMGIALTRLGHDLQQWSSHAYRFVRWPDDLVSTSSIMPQKRNAFVLENIRGLAVRPSAALVNCLMAMKSTPFSNSVEVGTEAVAPAWPAFAAAGDALRLMALLLRHMEVDRGQMLAFLDGAETTMTALADHLVARHGLAFRTAHDAVASLVRELPKAPLATAAVVATRLQAILAAAAVPPISLDRQAVEETLDPARSVMSARHGGGPAPAAVRRQLDGLGEIRARLKEQVAGWRRRHDEADVLRQQAAAAIRGQALRS
jgi:argininosuccinate lyase